MPIPVGEMFLRGEEGVIADALFWGINWRETFIMLCILYNRLFTMMP